MKIVLPRRTKNSGKKSEPVENNLLPLFIFFGFLHLRPFKLKVILNLRDAHFSGILESPSSYIELPVVHLSRVANHKKAWGRHGRHLEPTNLQYHPIPSTTTRPFQAADQRDPLK